MVSDISSLESKKDNDKQPEITVQENLAEEAFFESRKRFNYDYDTLEDLLKAGVEKKSNWFPFLSSCDTLPQSPKLSNKAVVDTCDIELSDIYERSRDSVVKIQLSDGSSGTGFLVCDDNICAIATNAHVVDDNSRVNVISNTNHSVVARVSQVDKKNDLALIEFNSNRLPGVRPLPLFKTEQVSAEPVFTIGHSRGLDKQVISAGRIKNPDTWTYTSGKDGKAYYEKYIQSNLEIYPGNSGGPLINGKGAVVGVIAARSPNRALGPNAESLRELLNKERQNS